MNITRREDVLSCFINSTDLGEGCSKKTNLLPWRRRIRHSEKQFSEQKTVTETVISRKHLTRCCCCCYYGVGTISEEHFPFNVMIPSGELIDRSGGKNMRLF
ncbi:hypothetical protein CDAR_402671 [Caerostris darwini]|nr:hypothetical protein CDAR_402671 [Caerostris darwini]